MNKRKLQPDPTKNATRRNDARVQERLTASRELARQIEHRRERLAPKFPHIDPHDLDLMIAGLLKTPLQRTEVMFLKRREDGFYVF